MDDEEYRRQLALATAESRQTFQEERARVDPYLDMPTDTGGAAASGALALDPLALFADPGDGPFEVIPSDPVTPVGNALGAGTAPSAALLVASVVAATMPGGAAAHSMSSVGAHGPRVSVASWALQIGVLAGLLLFLHALLRSRVPALGAFASQCRRLWLVLLVGVTPTASMMAVSAPPRRSAPPALCIWAPLLAVPLYRSYRTLDMVQQRAELVVLHATDAACDAVEQAVTASTRTMVTVCYAACLTILVVTMGRGAWWLYAAVCPQPFWGSGVRYARWFLQCITARRGTRSSKRRHHCDLLAIGQAAMPSISVSRPVRPESSASSSTSPFIFLADARLMAHVVQLRQKSRGL